MKTITLTVQSNGSNGWRLGINQEDSKNIFRCRKVKVRIYFTNNFIIECFTACGNPCDNNGNWIKINPKTGKPYAKKGYDLNKKELSFWLSEKYPNKKNEKPRKLKFNLTNDNEAFLLHFVAEIKH